ncbi:AraC family transcriptional regulator [Novosphingobium sp. PP1Y]|uniref:helix-turn-helix domain-containing protein n=1 Tax=Novosphingobium sp. PP1Y TaxID=702113 RepID=UPI0011D22745|nr:helix-turn-helix transcriptional regulator [Novosphingobium sp. PP1Y]
MATQSIRPQKQRIEVSAEMLSFVGPGAVPGGIWPEKSVIFAFEGLQSEKLPLLRFCAEGRGRGELAQAELVLVVQRVACQRIFGHLPDRATTWHVPSDLRMIGLAIVECEASPSARPTLQLARSIELLCRIFAASEEGQLIPAQANSALSELETARIVAARRMVDERWQEKLTLEGIARACCLNRDKLTRGFRALYDCSVADRLAENRLTGARRLLLATDLAVSEIAYRCGYLNNASFARAFSRRFGSAPSQIRQGKIAA